MAPAKAFKTFIVFFSIFLWSFGSAAQRADAGFDAENVNILTPTSAWLVGPATLSPVQNAGFSMPCLMMNQYNNGFVVRISGGGERVMAMAIDFRQKAFNAGDAHDLQVQIGDFNQKITAAALNETTLLLDMQNTGGIYKALEHAKYMNVSFGNEPFTFALLGVGDGLRRVEQCYDPGKNQQRQSMQGGQQAAGFSTFVPGMGADKASGKGAESANDRGEKVAGVPPAYRSENVTADVPAERAMAAPQAEEPDAGKSFADRVSSLDQMISNVASKLERLETSSGRQQAPQQKTVDIQVQPDTQGNNRESAGNTRQQAAVTAQPIGRPLANSWGASYTGRSTGMAQERVAPASLPGADQGYLPTVRRWRTISGSNLRDVLGHWAQSENARLVWRTDREYAVKRSFSLEGTFEQVVANLIGQYNDQSVRPSARVFMDPQSGQKILLVESY